MEIRLYTGSGSPLNGVVETYERCAVLIPCFNEARTIGHLVAAVRQSISGVWVVDDGSSDLTRAQAEKAGAVVIRHETNLGKGASLRAGLTALGNANFEWVITLDGDMQHDPADIGQFSKQADLVIGNRMAHADKMPPVRRFVNRWTSEKISRRLGLDVPDSQCGFRLIRLAAYQNVHLRESRFAFESEMIVAFARAGYKIDFVPIQTLPAIRGSRIHPIVDTLRWFRWWLRS
jgi:glycosyltransferase involved in cell wall biosynthesis